MSRWVVRFTSQYPCDMETHPTPVTNNSLDLENKLSLTIRVEIEVYNENE